MCLAVPGRIRSVFDDRGVCMGQVEFADVRKTVCLAFVPEAGVGDYVLVHAGFAISRVDQQTARETLDLLARTGELDGHFEPSSAPPPACPAMYTSHRPPSRAPDAEP